MKFVLYNASNYVEKLPKFNYEGDFVLRPNETHEITEDMVEFYRPWHSVGIQVRRLQDFPETPASTKAVETSVEVESREVKEEDIEQVKAEEKVETVEQVETSIPEIKEEEIVESPSVEAKVTAEVKTPPRTSGTNRRRGRSSKSK